MPHNRRDVLKGIGVGATGLAAGGAGTVTANDHNDDSNQARVRVVHASPDAPNVDVSVDGNEVLSDVAFGDVSDYLEVEEGTYEVTIAAANDPSTVAFQGDVTVNGGTDYTIAAIGELSENTFRPLVLTDDTKQPVEHVSYVRAIHASPDAPAVDVTIGNGSITLFKNISFGDATDYVALPAIDLTVEIRPASGGDPVATERLDLQGETSYSLFAKGYLSTDDEPTDESIRLAGVVDGQNQPDPTARVRVAHASPDAPDVDVFLDGNKVLSGVPFRAVSDYLEVPAGTTTARITAAGDPSTVAFEGDLTLSADTDYTVAAIGELSESTFKPLVLEDDNETVGGTARVRVVHASPDAPAVDVTVNDAATTLVDGLGFGEASSYLELKPGTKTVEVRPDSASNDNPFDAEFQVKLQPERVYTVFAEGYFTVDDEPTDEQFGLVLATDAMGH